jgi:hypothetical protein
VQTSYVQYSSFWQRLQRKRKFCCLLGNMQCGLPMTHTKQQTRYSKHCRQKKTMLNAERFAYTITRDGPGAGSLMPKLPITLFYQQLSTATLGLLDTGAAVKVLPYQTGIELGAVWEPEAATLRLAGNLAQFDACPIFVQATVGHFAPVRLAFAWTRAENVPLILGQVNFSWNSMCVFIVPNKHLKCGPNPKPVKP